MPATIPPAVKNLLQSKALAHVATIMPDGSPQVTPVWVDAEDNHILVNTAEGRAKPRNLRRDPRIALSITDPDNPYRAAFIRGRVVDFKHEGADEHIDKMAKKYLGADSYPNRTADEQRVILVIEPESISGMGT